MKNTRLRVALSSISLFAILLAITSTAHAAPVRFSQVVQVVNAKPGRANTGGFTQLRLMDDPTAVKTQSGDDPTTPTQDKRVIVTTTSEMIEDDACDCLQPPVPGGFPKWALFGLAAIPIGIILINRKKDTPTPTPTGTPDMTPTMTTTPTPPTQTPTPPTMTPTPDPVPEPMTILLFGSGLAGIGIAARKRLRRKSEDESESEDEK